MTSKITGYLMESCDEAIRLDKKTEETVVEKQATWAGLQSGMSVADVCCGSGKATSVLHRIVCPTGQAVGIDSSEQRIAYARKYYGKTRLDFVCRDIKGPLADIGKFDLVWVRFALEYFREEAFDLVSNISTLVRPGGIFCLIDLDHNCLNHYQMPERLERTVCDISRQLTMKANFDPYSGRKLYSHLYRLGYADIEVDIGAHHLIVGELKEHEAYNWLKKVEMIFHKLNYSFPEYPGGHQEFHDEFWSFFMSPDRFTYTPIICCRGRRPE